MTIRKTEMEDLDTLLEIYSYAREQMKMNGNPTQWGDKRPSTDKIINDIKNKVSYVLEDNGSICGVFAFITDEEPTYSYIEDGAWLNDKPYGTIHRIASNGRSKGVFEAAIKYCEDQLDNIRIDTHRDNKIMQHLILKNGFEYCGIIYVDDGSSRLAYQKEIKNKKA